MKTEEQSLSAHQSLEIITSMIREAKGKARQNAFYFLFWGWIVVIANIGMFVLAKTGYSMPYIVWLITFPAWVYTIYRGFTHGRREGSSSSHFDRISASVWMSFGVVTATLIVFGYMINFQLNPIILIVASIPTFCSGIIIKFKPLLFGGVLFWLFGIICFLLPFDLQPLAGAAAIAGGYLVPGYMLRTKKDSNV
jgi:hypothetical protein